MRDRRALWIVLLLIGGCVPTAPPPATDSPAPANEAPHLNATALARAAHERINEERRSEGLSPLAWDEALVPLAVSHSDDMAARGFFAHKNPDGQDVNDRAEALERTCERREGNVLYHGFGENLFVIHRYAGYETRRTPAGTVVTYDWYSEAALVRQAVEGWLQSPGHRRNLLGAQYRAHAIGIAFSDDDRVYFTDVFC